MPTLRITGWFSALIATMAIAAPRTAAAQSSSAPGCAATLCASPPLPAGTASGFRHPRAQLIAHLGHPRHRALDTMAREGNAFWIIGRFAYGPEHAGLHEEDVDVYALEGCTHWRLLGSAITTREHEHTEVGGVPDTGGRVYFQVPASAHWTPGLHRVLLVVRGDRSSAEATVDIVADDVPVVVSDVDGTLTQSENAVIWSEAHVAADPTAHPGAPEALQALAARGYQIIYLTARPEWLTVETHRWLESHHFPAGIVHTSYSELGYIGTAAQQFKTRILAALVAELRHPPAFAFGNRLTDVAAYGSAGIAPARCFYYQLAGELQGGHRIDDYRAIVSTLEHATSGCVTASTRH